MAALLDKLWAAINNRLQTETPSRIIVGTFVAMYVMRKVCARLPFAVAWNESLRAYLGRLALCLAVCQKEVKKELVKNLKDTLPGGAKKWEKFGPLITSIPANGVSTDKLKQLVDYWSSMVNKPLSHEHFSGTIYSASLLEDKDEQKSAASVSPSSAVATTIPHPLAFLSTEQGGEGEREKPGMDLSNTANWSVLSKSLGDLYTHAFRHSYLWNSLHGNEFCIGDYLSYCVVHMVADMFGGEQHETMGFVTSGGTESLMNAMRMYREWGMKNRNHQPGESVIIAAESVHAAVIKAGSAYHMKVVLVPVDKHGKADLRAMRAQAAYHGSKVVCIVGSGPSYGLGVVDPIAPLALLAKELGCGMHVDCCLGGFIVNNVPRTDGTHTNFLAMDGVTSLSADTHKNGWAPKGSSVLVCKHVSDKVYGSVNLAMHSIYSIPGWAGGVYGTPKDAGSQGCVHVLQAFLALMAIGKRGYKDIALKISSSCQAMAEVITQHPATSLVHIPEVNVVAFQLDPAKGYPRGAVYGLLSLMEKRGFVVSALKNDMAHFCITGRFASNPHTVQQFSIALADSVEALDLLCMEVKAGRKIFSPEAGMYGTLSSGTFFWPFFSLALAFLLVVGGWLFGWLV